MKANLFQVLAEKGDTLIEAADLTRIAPDDLRTGVLLAFPTPVRIVRDRQNRFE